MRIALLSYRSKTHCGGQGVYVRHLSRGLEELGHDVEVFLAPKRRVDVDLCSRCSAASARALYHHAVRLLLARKWVDVGLAAVVIASLLTLTAVVLPSGTPGAAWLATASNCPQVQVVFARGRYESPGTGVLGNAFINSLESKVSGKNIGVYAVKYPADTEVDVGANDMSHHIQSVVNNCPDTRLVLGGYSLGAAVTDVVLAMPFNAFGFDSPLPDGTDQHIAAVALFGNGSQWVGPITNFNPIYNDRTIELCHGADPVCNPADPHTWQDNWPQHLANAYIQAGMADQAADFVASKL